MKVDAESGGNGSTVPSTEIVLPSSAYLCGIETGMQNAPYLPLVASHENEDKRLASKRSHVKANSSGTALISVPNGVFNHALLPNAFLCITDVGGRREFSKRLNRGRTS